MEIWGQAKLPSLKKYADSWAPRQRLAAQPTAL